MLDVRWTTATHPLRPHRPLRDQRESRKTAPIAMKLVA